MVVVRRKEDVEQQGSLQLGVAREFPAAHPHDHEVLPLTSPISGRKAGNASDTNAV
jgi:hypothetical protein